MRDLLPGLINGILVVVGAALGAGVLFWRPTKRKLGEEANLEHARSEVALSDAALRLLAPYQAEVGRLREQLDRLQRERLEDSAQIKGLALELDATKRHSRALQRYIIDHVPDAKGVPTK